MQTFLPYPSFAESASVLDRLRLGKQRVETLQILKCLAHSNGWQHHPVVKMWRGFEVALCHYGIAICKEWLSRGYKDTVLAQIRSYVTSSVETNPPWLHGIIHSQYRALLMYKNPTHYGQFGWSEMPIERIINYPKAR